MTKKKIIVAALALCLVLAGTGYAYWTDALNITTKATTGELEVKFLDLGLLAQYTNENTGYGSEEGWSIIDGIDDGYVDNAFFRRGNDNHNSIAKAGSIDDYKDRANGYNQVDFDAKYDGATRIDVNIDAYNAGMTDVSDKINISVENIYPGYAQAFRTDIANTGNIAAKLSKIAVDVIAKSDEIIKKNVGIAIYMHKELSNNDDGDVFMLADLFDESEIFELGGVDFVRLSALANPSAFDDDILKDTLKALDCKNRMDLYLGIAMDPDAGNDTMNGSVDFTIDLDWVQFNAGDDVSTTNILEKQNKKPNAE